MSFRISCFCGQVFSCEGNPLDLCPVCREPVGPLDAVLDDELQEILDEAKDVEA